MRRAPATAVFVALALGSVLALSPQAPPKAAQTAPPPLALTLPNRSDSLRFAVLGDFGTGKKPQYELAAVMARAYAQFPFELVILVGDNLYGSERPQDFQKKFEIPYKPLLDAGVKFYASLGNHDAREQRYYKLFNMDGRLYYGFNAKQSVRFFALESTYLDPQQVAWFEKDVSGSDAAWKIPYFHHPPYSSGNRHGSNTRIREVLEPLFLKHGVTTVFTGHDHFYERTKPQKGIIYFVVGSGGQLRKGNIDRRSGLTEKGLDTDYAFLLVEINGNEMHFNAVSRASQVFDIGVINRRQ
jgi:hypothetical protein